MASNTASRGAAGIRIAGVLAAGLSLSLLLIRIAQSAPLPGPPPGAAGKVAPAAKATAKQQPRASPLPGATAKAVAKAGAKGKAAPATKAPVSKTAVHPAPKQGQKVPAGAKKAARKQPSSKLPSRPGGTARQNPAPRNAQCNYSNGSWVKDPKPDYGYTGLTCSSMWHLENCQENKRPDSAYLFWKWTPHQPGCQLPRFNARAFLQRHRNKVMAFVGDSLMSNFEDTLQCSMAAITPVKLTRLTYGTQKYYGYRADAFNLTVVKVPTGFLVNAKSSAEGAGERSGKAANGVWRVYLNQPQSVWLALLPHLDVMVFDIGVWYTAASPTYRQYYIGAFKQPFMTGVQAMAIALGNIRDAIVNHPAFKGVAVFMTFSPVHYGPIYRYPSGSCVGSTSPLSLRFGGALADRFDANMMVHDVQMAVIKGIPMPSKWKMNTLRIPAPSPKAAARFRVLDITRLSLFRGDAHTQKYISKNGNAKDCVHWCNPGVPNTWLDIFAQII